MSYLLMRFWWLSLTGKTVAVIALTYGAGWIAGSLGYHDIARQLGTVALDVLGVLLAVIVIRWLWAAFTGKPGE